MKTVLVVVAAVLLFGYAASGGPVRREDGTIDASATLQESAEAGGDMAGRGLDDVGNSIGHGLGSAVSSSDLAKVGVAGGAAAAAVKWLPKRPSFNPKPVTVTALPPTTQPPKKPAKPAPPATTPTVAPMSPGFTAPSFRLPEATWKPCVAPPGLVVNC